MEHDIELINQKVASYQEKIKSIRNEIDKVVVGQHYMVERLLMGVLVGGHILVEGVPGIAKTTTVNALANTIRADFQRIQFTPDLLPADILGTQVYNPKNQEFYIKKGPLFHNIILADEINRAPAKVQSALLEAMQEKQITIGDETYPLVEPFIVLATQKSIEQEGTYPLPEAQVDRFMFKLVIGYPSREEELKIMDRFANKVPSKIEGILYPEEIMALRELIRNIHMDQKISEYIVRLIFATRESGRIDKELGRYIQFGASPRASIFLNLASKAHAFMKGRGYVIPEDVKAMAPDILRHRILLSFEAEAEEITTDFVLKKILDQVEVP